MSAVKLLYSFSTSGPSSTLKPISEKIDDISSIFSEIGFSVEEGPDVENEYNNFTALNTPENHPARDMHDTFYLDENKEVLLRTHTSPVQIRTMLKDKPPFKIIAPGRTYRSDSDQTHAPMFHLSKMYHAYLALDDCLVCLEQ